jgi:FdhD protein
VVRVRRGGRDASGEADDQVAVESPLEVRLHGEPFSVIMRTPGADRDLTAGFLFSEGVIRSAADLVGISLLTESVVDVRLSDDRAQQVPAYLDSRRQVATNSSCGMCGRRSLESLEIDEPALGAHWTVDADVIAGLPERLRAAQVTFDETGGLHAAGLFALDGSLDVSAEDVGRHNAVDKIIGRKLYGHRLPLDRAVLFVSGRSSFEIVQKAFLAGIPLIGSVSAPSGLAVDLAERAGITLVGFVRDGRFNVYGHGARIRSTANG